jgi:CheY-like chemotaxis protein
MLQLIGLVMPHSGLCLLKDTHTVGEPPLAVGGSAAPELLSGGLRPSVILFGLMMPGMDGWDFRHARLAEPAESVRTQSLSSTSSRFARSAS